MSYAPNYADAVSPRCYLRRQDPQRCETRRSPVEQPTKFELDHQSENRQANWPDDPIERPGAGGQGDQVITCHRDIDRVHSSAISPKPLTPLCFAARAQADWSDCHALSPPTTRCWLHRQRDMIQ